jgi:hypothetical protein
LENTTRKEMQLGDAVKVIHKAEPHKNFRPQTQNRLIEFDGGLFVLRYSSFWHCSEILSQVKNDIFHKYEIKASNEFNKFVEEIKIDVFNPFSVSVCHYCAGNVICHSFLSLFFVERCFFFYRDQRRRP